jgi:hypothetical protein
MLRRAIRRVAGHAESSEHGRDVDDASPVRQQRYRLLRHEECAEDVRIENPPPVRGIGLLYGPTAADAGVVHEHVEPIARLAQPPESGRDRRFVTNVHGQQHGRRPTLLDLRSGRLEVRARARRDGHRRARFGERQRDRAADAAPSSRYENSAHFRIRNSEQEFEFQTNSSFLNLKFPIHNSHSVSPWPNTACIRRETSTIRTCASGRRTDAVKMIGLCCAIKPENPRERSMRPPL